MEMGQIQTLSDDSGGKPCILDDSGFLNSFITGNGFKLNSSIDQYQWIVIICHLTIAWIGGIGEELGWSVWLLSRLANQMGRTRAVMISGVLRGIWHLPIVMGSVFWRLNNGKISMSIFLLSLIQYCILLPATGILLSSIWGYVWYKTQSIPLIGWTHQSYDAVRDIAVIAVVNFGNYGILYNLYGLAVMLAATVLFLILMKREEKLT